MMSIIYVGMLYIWVVCGILKEGASDHNFLGVLQNL